MQTLRYARHTRAFFSPLAPPAASTTTAFLLSPFSSTKSYPFSSSYSFFPPSWPNSTASNGSQSEKPQTEVVNYFREWFMSRKKPLFDRVFEIIRTEGDESSADLALSRLNLHLSERVVLDALNYGKNDVLSCLTFFDWAGRQPGFHHTRATFNAIFRIILKAKHMSLMFDFLQNYVKMKYAHKASYYSVLVIGYAVAGKCDTALQLFGKMRFVGVDLDAFAYHVLMNSLVDQGYFDVVDVVAKQIRLGGFEDKVTHSIMVKKFCKQGELGRGLEYLHGLVQNDETQLSGIAVGTLVDALCKDNQFERASSLVEEFRRKGLCSMEHAYGVWIRNIVKLGQLDGALEFLKDKQVIEGYVPDVFRYNMLVCRLLRENRMEEVYDLMVDMKEKVILPNDATMSAILCFLCKAGLMDIAMDLYDSRKEFGLSVNYMAYNYLINALLGDVSVDEAYRVLRNSIDQGYLPGPKTLSLIFDALCREGRLDKMKELVNFTLDQNIMPKNLTYDMFISALCKCGRHEEGYLLHGMLNNLNKVAQKRTYADLIGGFSKSSRGDIAARLIIEMQENGYTPSKKLVREVIHCLCKTDNPEKQIFRLLEMQIAPSSISFIYHCFMGGAGHAKKPELALQVYEMMRKNGIEPRLKSDILLLQSYLNSRKISHALHLFRYLSMKNCKKKLWDTMITGLCKARKPEYASHLLVDMKAKKYIPTIECYEILVNTFCDLGQYHKAIDAVNDMTQMGRCISSFIGNVFLLHALKTRKVYDAWAYLSHRQNLTPACSMLGHVIGVFSGAIEGNQDDEELVQLIQQCFHIDMYTNNMLLRRLSKNGMDNERACKFLDRVREKGYEPNRWTYDIIVHGLAKHGWTQEAKLWAENMLSKGFDLTEKTKRYLYLS